MRQTQRRPEGERGSRVRLPHPRGHSSTLDRARSVRRLFGPFAVLGIGGVLAVGKAFHWAYAFPGFIFFLVLFFLLWRRGRMLSVVVEGDEVRLPLEGISLRSGRGELQVRPFERHTKNGRLLLWELSHSIGGVIAGDCAQPLAVRAAAEGLALLGKWPIVWFSPEHELIERRGPDELDLPLAVREAREPTIAHDYARPYDASYEDQPLEGEPRGVRLLFRGGVMGRLGIDAIAVLGTLCFSGFVVASSVGWWAALPPVVVALLAGPAVTPEVEVSPRGIRLVYRTLGGLLRFRRWLPASAIESLYIDTLPGKRLVAVGDGFQATVAYARHPFEAGWLRGLIAKTLVREGVPLAAPAGDRAAERPEASSALERVEATCPTCSHLHLERLGGALDELRCPACGGRFLQQAGVERLVEEELGVTRDMLRELSRYFGGERRTCPSCRSRMSAVRLKGVTADLCTGCGGLWLDPGELGQLSSGRYEG